MSQKEVAIVGHNNTRAQVTGQEELLVKVNSIGSTSGIATETTLQQVEVNTSGVSRTPGLIRPTIAGNVNTVAVNFYSVSVANVGMSNGTVLGVTIKPGEILNFSADALNNYFTSFAYDATGTEFIIIYIV
jgi:cytoskeletal protein RodZ